MVSCVSNQPNRSKNGDRPIGTMLPAEYKEFRPPLQRYAATECDVMPPLHWLPDECSKSHPRQRRAQEIRTWSNPVFKGLRDANCPIRRLFVHVTPFLCR